jgi:hypothetical protein
VQVIVSTEKNKAAWQIAQKLSNALWNCLTWLYENDEDWRGMSQPRSTRTVLTPRTSGSAPGIFALPHALLSGGAWWCTISSMVATTGG